MERHEPPMAKQPVVMLTPLAKVEDPVPRILMMPEVTRFPVVVVAVPMPRPVEAMSLEVEAREETERKVVVALVVVEFMMERLVMVEEALFTRMPPVNEAREEKVESPETERVAVVASVKVSEVKLWEPEMVMASGMSASVRPVNPDTVALERVTPDNESIFWVRVIILTFPSVREERLEMEERREKMESETSSRMELLRDDISERREERRSLMFFENSSRLC